MSDSMKKNINKIIKEIKNLSKKAYEQILRIINWRKGEPCIWVCKTFIVIVVFFSLLALCYLFFKYVWSYLIAIIVFIFLILVDRDPTPNTTNSIDPDMVISRDLLCSVLLQYAEMFDLEQPTNVKDITPVYYPVLQHINDVYFYRFIIREKSDFDLDYDTLQADLYLFVAQTLQHGFPNIPQPFYNGIPTVCVFKVEKDLSHEGFLYIDVIPVVSQEQYNFAYNYINKRDSFHENHHVYDKEF